MSDFEHVTTEAVVKTYESARAMFTALLREVRELSKKKPDATLSASKVKVINTVLNDLMTVLDGEPQAKYLHALEDDELPQVSDALMMMAQFDAALDAFRHRYFQYPDGGDYFHGKQYWITEEQLAEWDQEDAAMGDDVEVDGEE